MKNQFFYRYAVFFGFLITVSCNNEQLSEIKLEKTKIGSFLTPNSLFVNQNSLDRKLQPSVPVCIENGMCWGNQLPEGGEYGLAGTSPSDVWTLSSNGQGLFYFNGTSWSLIPNSFGINGRVWTQTPNKIWILDSNPKIDIPNGALFQCEPTGCHVFSKIPMNDLYLYPYNWNMVGTEPNHFWFYGDRPYPAPAVYYFDGTKPVEMQWTTVDFHQMARTDLMIQNTYLVNQLWGAFDNDLWATLISEDSTNADVFKVTAIHYNGNRLDRKQDLISVPKQKLLHMSMVGTSSHNLWITYPKSETESVFYHYNGTSWEEKTDFPFPTTFLKETVNPPFWFKISGNNIFMQANNQDDGYNHIWLLQNENWYQLKTGMKYFLFATGMDNLWWMDKNNNIQTTHSKFSSQSNLYLSHLLYDGKDTLWFSSLTPSLERLLVRYKKDEPSQIYQLEQGKSISALWSNEAKPEEIWIATTDGNLTLVLDNKTHSLHPIKSYNTFSTITALWGSQTHGLWAVDHNHIWQFQDPYWVEQWNQTIPEQTNFSMIEGTGSNTLWVGGKNILFRGSIQNMDVTWNEVGLNLPSSVNYQILKGWNTGENNVWFTVNVWEKNTSEFDGTRKLLHFDGKNLSFVKVPFDKVYDFTGDSKGNIWVTASNNHKIGLWQMVNGSWVERVSGGLFGGDLEVTEWLGLFIMNNPLGWLWKSTN